MSTTTPNPMKGPTPSKAPGEKTRQCTATTRGGVRCKKAPILGGTVCRLHGGSAPQVKRKAALRLLELVDPAIATLAREMGTAQKSADRQRAANSILDRAGYGRSLKVEEPDARELLVDLLIQAASPESKDSK